MLPIEAGDHGNRELAAGLLQVAQVELGTHMEHGPIRHVGERFASAFASHQAQVMQVELLLLQLLLKKGMEHDRRSPGLLQP
ncbi:MAG: hypothetical protein ACK559_15675, partial [bacterium]